jgi:hypothetical protein
MPSALPVCDFVQKKRIKRRAPSRKEMRRFFCTKSRGFISEKDAAQEMPLYIG